LLGDACVEELRGELATMSVAAATESITKVDRLAEIAALAAYVKKTTTGRGGKDKIRGALQATMAGFGCGVYQVVQLYESTASTDARTL
jgi:hypothetical protein